MLAAVVTASVFPLARRLGGRRRAVLLAGPVAAAISGAVFAWFFDLPATDVIAATYVPDRVDDKGFVTSQTCRSCHPGQYATWHHTYHRTMTQVAQPGMIEPEINAQGVSLSTHGESARIFRRGDEYWVSIADPELTRVRVFARDQAGDEPIAVPSGEPPQVERRIVMTTGSHHFQVFWMTSRLPGELWQFPWRYHIPERRWIHRHDVFLQPPDKPASADHRLWNQSCIHCHSVGGQPGLRFFNPAGAPEPVPIFSETRVGELGIACEACHGPAERHVAKYRHPGRRIVGQVVEGSTNHDTLIVNPLRCSPRIASQVCGQCHSHHTTRSGDTWTPREFVKTGLNYRAGDDLEKFVRFLAADDGFNGNEHRFWADGTCRSGGREYNGMLASPCYQPQHKHSMQCGSCHSMHSAPDRNDQLVVDKPDLDANGNQACTQCHPKYASDKDLEAHTHHPIEFSSGNRCYNCHMPHTSYALFKAIRSHQVDSPAVEPIRADGRPNACNLCHLDQTLAWTSTHLSDWYGQPSVTLPADEREVSAAVLWMLKGDPAQRAIVAWHAGWSDARETKDAARWLPPLLSQLLDDRYAAVRYMAWRSLKQLPGFDEFPYEFDGPQPDRREAVDEAVRLWYSLNRGFDPPPHLLLNAAGKLERDRVERFKKMRDDRRVEIYE